MKKIFFLMVLTFAVILASKGQNLSFSSPVNFVPGAHTDKAMDITNFKGGFFAIWKDAGPDGVIHLCYLGIKYGSFKPHEWIIETAHSASAPVLRVLQDRIYAMWIEKDGSLAYCFNDTDTSFNLHSVHKALFDNGQPLKGGITSAALGNRVMITSHSGTKDLMMYAILEVDKNGIFKKAVLNNVPGGRSADYPFVAALSDSVARITWRGYKDQNIYFCDFELSNSIWSSKIRAGKSQSGVPPAIYRVFNSDNLFYVWMEANHNRRMTYMAAASAGTPAIENELPAYFFTTHAVSISNVDQNKFILSYVGVDNKLYLSFFTSYNPSHWMQDILFPGKSEYSLKDIVLPGAHDAGMSILTAVGGQQSGTINECNTLTQIQDVAGQLNAGIRMLDLRVGRYNHQLYTKHCSSDCMSDAIGGGYGESLHHILSSIKRFLQDNKKETVLISFSHFCEKEASTGEIADSIVSDLGTTILFANDGKPLNEVSLSRLAGKAVVTFEGYARSDRLINSCSISGTSRCFINFKREYAATNKLLTLKGKEKLFFVQMGKLQDNDLVRLDWQLTQSSDEAAMVCNDFQDEKMNPVINSAMLLTNIIKKHQSVIDLSLNGNSTLPVWINESLNNGTLTRTNKPNILYVDVAGTWITDYCIELNRNPLYDKTWISENSNR